VPRRIGFSVISANQRSTWLIQEAEAGVKWGWKRGWRATRFLSVSVSSRFPANRLRHFETVLRHRNTLGNRLVLQAGGALKNDQGTQRQRQRCLALPHPGFKSISPTLIQHNLQLRPASARRFLLPAASVPQMSILYLINF
jgi:hypothetical protein